MKFAFSVLDLKGLEIFTALSSKYRFPVIIQVTARLAAVTDVCLWSASVKLLRNRYKAQVMLNLDHAKDEGLVKKCVDAGWDMVFFDGSALPYEEHLRKLKTIVQYAHQRKILVEGELGGIAGQDEAIEKFQMTPDKVKNFVRQTGVDYIGLPFGTYHGLGRKVRIDYSLMKNMDRILNVPLCLHGGSGLSKQTILKSLACGIEKVNISTEVKLAYFNAHRRYKPKGFDDFIRHPSRLDDLLEDEIEKLFIKKMKYVR